MIIYIKLKIGLRTLGTLIDNYNRNAPGDHVKRVLAISSGGGHWVQLLRLRSGFNEAQVIYATVDASNRSGVPGERFIVISDATMWNKFKLTKMAIEVLWLIIRVRPHTIISTGAAPGYFAIRFGKLIGAQTIWVDSMANVERLSLAGQKVGKYADLWLTQWPHLATEDGPTYLGSVL